MTRIGDETASGFTHGRRAGVGVASTSLATGRPLAKGVEIKAAASNAGVIYVGGLGVTADAVDATDGFPLAPGESLFLPVDDLGKVFVIGTVANQKVFWLAV